MAHNVGSLMRYVRSLSTHLAPIQRLSLLLAVCYLAVFHGLLFLSLSVTSLLLDTFPGEYVSCTLTTPRLDDGVSTLAASVE
jgi:hypothetical protein